MAQPQAVRRAARQAEDAFKAAYTAGNSEEEEPEEEAVEGTPQSKQDTDDGQANGHNATSGGDEDEDTEDTPAPVDAAQGGDDRDWQQQYNTLKGKYDAEVPRLSRENRELANRLAGLEEMLSTLSSQPPQPVQPEQQQQAAKPSGLTQQELEDYGQDFFDMLTRHAKGVVTQEVNILRRELNDIKRRLGSVDTTVRKTSQDKVFDALDRRVDDWRVINESQEFLDWLSLHDPYAGRPRQDLLNEAFRRHDAERVIAFFEGYKQEITAVQQAHQPSRQTQPNKGQGAKRQQVETMVEPGGGRTGSTDAPNEKPVYTQADISKFYRDAREGKISGERKEAKERDILAAASEGRIR